MSSYTSQGSVVSLASPLVSLSNPVVSFASGQLVSLQPSVTSWSHDAFGKLRISEPQTLLDLKHVYDKQPLLESETTANSASSTHLPNEATVRMDVTTAQNSRIVRQSKRYVNYQPGKSHLVMVTGVLHTSTNAGLVARMGYFDNHADKSVDSGGNGFFLEYSGGEYFLVRRSYVSGSQVDTKIARANWLDPFDGHGASGITLDFTKAQILAIDLEWLGVGGVRIWFIVGRVPHLAYTFDHTNLISTTYMTRASLPVRYELEQTAAADGVAGSMKQICATVISEGGFVRNGMVPAYTPGTVTLSNTNETHAFSLSLKNGYNRVSVLPVSVDAGSPGTTAVAAIMRVYMYTALTNPSWSSAAHASSAVQVSTAGTLSTTSAMLVGACSVTTNGGANHVVPGDNMLLCSNIAGTSDILSVTLQRVGQQSIDIIPSIRWQEMF